MQTLYEEKESANHKLQRLSAIMQACLSAGAGAFCNPL
jgi:hypothetical protein